MKKYVKKHNVTTPIDKRKKLIVGYRCDIMKDDVWYCKFNSSTPSKNYPYLEGHHWQLTSINNDIYTFMCSAYIEEYAMNRFIYDFIWNREKNIFYMIDNTCYGAGDKPTEEATDREADGAMIYSDNFLPYLFKNIPKFSSDLSQFK